MCQRRGALGLGWAGAGAAALIGPAAGVAGAGDGGGFGAVEGAAAAGGWWVEAAGAFARVGGATGFATASSAGFPIGFLSNLSI